MILLGGFAVYIFEVAGGTDYEYKYLGLASVVAGLCIMILLAFPTVRKFNWPRLRPWVVFVILAWLILLLLF